MANKSTLQKGYEKLLMAQRNPEELCLVVSKENENKPCFVLCIGDIKSKDIVPLAIILDQKRFNNLEDPSEYSWKVSERIKNLIDDVSKIDERTKKEDFDENHQAVDEVFNRELNIDLFS